MPIIKEPIDFINKPESEAKKWGKEEEKRWFTKLNNLEEVAVNQLKNKEEKTKIDNFSKDVLFFSLNSIQTMKNDKNQNLLDVERIREALLRNNLDRDAIGYVNFTPKELGINFPIRDIELNRDISDETLDKVRQQIINQEYTKFSFISLGLNDNSIDESVPVIVKTRVPTTFNYGVLNDKETVSLLLNQGFSIIPESAIITNIKGKDYILIEGSLSQELDFYNKGSEVWGMENYGDYVSKLSKEQIGAINGYLKSDYKAINSYLKNGRVPNNDELNKKIELISSALYIKPIPEKLIVYRRVGGAPFDLPSDFSFDKKENGEIISDKQKLNEFIDKWTGKEIKNLSFSSTSLKSAPETFKNSRFIFRLRLSEGTIGTYIYGFQGFDDEQEVLLNTNSTFKIFRITPITSIINKYSKMTQVVIDAEVIQNEEI
ncbi:ADP-ribosyltransferase [Clostridium botulinum]|uniref:ADP-ribosyltransferase n=1 Tax=Clostridium botulinum TaxID=1491 RepID=UPI0004D90294|nr:ADP-ribosyltransferase [Clostridium botulinum]KEH96663.1 C2 toxin, component I [Clostridium botulinum D str. 16868]NFF61337.1 C2 toxin, component I [Clostridium botulinum]NFL02569.1 C2 toxin, component I [Clostridium botulinum]